MTSDDDHHHIDYLAQEIEAARLCRRRHTDYFAGELAAGRSCLPSHMEILGATLGAGLLGRPRRSLAPPTFGLAALDRPRHLLEAIVTHRVASVRRDMDIRVRVEVRWRR